jgi:hypothetical protein
MCEQVIRDAHDKRFTKIKPRETYILSAKIGQSGLANQNIWFGKLDHPVFPDIIY